MGSGGLPSLYLKNTAQLSPQRRLKVTSLDPVDPRSTSKKDHVMREKKSCLAEDKIIARGEGVELEILQSGSPYE